MCSSDLVFVVVKIPRFDFPKFPSTDDVLGTSMQSVGEVMSIASTFTESLTKAIRSLEIGKTGIRNIDNRFINLTKSHLQEEIKTPRPRRIFAILEAIRRNWPIADIAVLSSIDIWFLREIEKSFNVTPDSTPVSILKMLGWTDEDLDSKEIKNNLEENRAYKLVDTCSAEFLSKTPYLYSTYGTSDDDNASNNKKVIVIGSGPNRIGQGIEFDYCCVHGVESLKEGVHYMRAHDREDMKRKIAGVRQERWKKMSNACVEWYKENVHSKGSWNTTIKHILYD